VHLDLREEAEQNSCTTLQHRQCRMTSRISTALHTKRADMAITAAYTCMMSDATHTCTTQRETTLHTPANVPGLTILPTMRNAACMTQNLSISSLARLISSPFSWYFAPASDLWRQALYPSSNRYDTHIGYRFDASHTGNDKRAPIVWKLVSSDFQFCVFI